MYFSCSVILRFLAIFQVLPGFSLGAGLKVSNFGLGLAFAQPHNGATTLMFNISYNLNEILQ